MAKKTARKKNPISVRFLYRLDDAPVGPYWFLSKEVSSKRLLDAFSELPKDVEYIGVGSVGGRITGPFLLRRKRAKWRLQELRVPAFGRMKLGRTLKTWSRKPKLVKSPKTLRLPPGRGRYFESRYKKLPRTKRKPNPLLMTVTNPTLRRSTGFRNAMKAYEKFHGTTPVKLTRVRVPEGTPPYLVEMGGAHAVEYRPTNRSQLADRGAKETIMKHRFGRSVKLVCDAHGKFVGFVDPKGKMKVSGLKGEGKLGIVG